MIQRIQSVYLALVVVLMGATLVSPLASFSEWEHHQARLYSFGILGETFAYLTWGIVTIGIAIALVALVEIFCYKKRKLQIKLSGINTWLIILFYITVAVYIYFVLKEPHIDLLFKGINYGLILPAISLILNILAKKKIQKDENLVRSLDRIR